jgi:PAS domain S-box-containing protein
MDITERKEAEERFQSVFEESPVAEVIVNEDGRITLVNGESEKTFGYDRDEMEGQPIEMLLPKRYRVNHPDHRAEFNATPQSRKMGKGRDLFARHKDGREFPIEVALHPLKIDDKSMVLSVIVDITERKQAEKEIEKQREQLEKANQELIDYHKNLEKIVEKRTTKLREEILERKQVEDKLRKSETSLASAQRIAHLGSWEWDIPENKTYWSDEVFRIFGFAPQQFEVTYESFLDRIHQNDRSFVEEAVNRVLAESETGYNIQHRIIRPDGTERIVHELGEVKLGEDGKPARMTGTMQDLTEFKNIEAETSQLRDELAHLNRVGIIGNMASAIAHEINQPLAAILSNSQAALRLLNIDPPDLNEVREALTDIADADKRAGEVIRRIRSMVKKEEFHRELSNINTLIGEVIDFVQSEVVIQNISLTTNLEPRVPGIYVDKIQMQQVILNLIMNALDAMKNQPIDARHIDIATSIEDKEDVEVRITDSGAGVDEDNIENIFNPFYTTKTQGMGLGLSVCHSIIENHGGRIWVENCSGGGAKFSFRLPFRMDDDL